MVLPPSWRHSMRRLPATGGGRSASSAMLVLLLSLDAARFWPLAARNLQLAKPPTPSHWQPSAIRYSRGLADREPSTVAAGAAAATAVQSVARESCDSRAAATAPPTAALAAVLQCLPIGQDVSIGAAINNTLATTADNKPRNVEQTCVVAKVLLVLPPPTTTKTTTTLWLPKNHRRAGEWASG